MVFLTPTGSYNMYKDTVDPSNKVSVIIQDENNRVASKKIKIDLEYETKKRKDFLLASDTARTNAYNRMFLVLVIITILAFGAVYLNSIFPLIPKPILDLFVMTIVSGGIIYLVILYIDIAKRDRGDFNKIDSNSLVDPKPKENKDVTTITTVSGETMILNGKTLMNLVSSSADCFGGCCCPAGTSIFIDNKCTKKEGFFGTIEPFSVRAKYMLL